MSALGALLICLSLAIAPGAAAVNFGDVNQFFIRGPTGGSQLPASIVSGNFNDDADPDLAVAAADELRVFLGARDGGFKPVAKPVARSGFGDFLQVIAVPLNSDSLQDLVSLGDGTGLGGRALTIVLAEPDGGFRAETFQPPTEISSIAAGDLDADGDTDLAAATQFDEIRTFLGDGAGGFAPGATQKLGFVGGGSGIVVANIDPGPSPDVVVAGQVGIQALLNDGTGAFALGPVVQYGSGNSPGSGFDAGDLNGDGITDLVAGSSLFRGQSVAHPLLGTGDGGFVEGAPVTVRYGFSAQLSPDAMRLADIDGDGRLDLLASNEDLDAGSFAVLDGNGSGGFRSQVAFASHKGPSGLVSDDFDRDGRLDVATANYYNGVSVATFLSRRGQVKCQGKPAEFVGFAAGEVSSAKRPPELSDAPFGADGTDVLSTGAGRDFGRGAGGNDAICGGGGDDTLAGAKGSDVILGGPGNDGLNGGSDKDRCIGGPGRDKFRSCESVRR